MELVTVLGPLQRAAVNAFLSQYSSISVPPRLHYRCIRQKEACTAHMCVCVCVCVCVWEEDVDMVASAWMKTAIHL